MKRAISVIIPNYNHARYLKKRIDSVLSQTYTNFELIILDDTSTDDSRNVIASYAANPRISQIVFNEQNSGSTFKQWQKGIELAKGEWIWLAESDDYCEPTLLETLVSNAEQCPGVVLSYCQSYYRQDGNEELNHDMKFFTDQVDTEHWKRDYCIEGTEEIANYLLYRCTIPNASAVIFKKSAYEQANKSFTAMRLCGDWMLWVQLLQLGKVAFSAQPLNHFRTHGATTRVMDSLAKVQRRISEEYSVAIAIQKAEIVSPAAVRTRLAEIASDYVKSLTSRDVLKFVFLPRSFEYRIPYLNVIKAKFLSLVR